jgi:hypothetical protein
MVKVSHCLTMLDWSNNLYQLVFEQVRLRRFALLFEDDSWSDGPANSPASHRVPTRAACLARAFQKLAQQGLVKLCTMVHNKP